MTKSGELVKTISEQMGKCDIGKRQAAFMKGSSASPVLWYGKRRSGGYTFRELKKEKRHFTLLPKALKEIKLHGQIGSFSHGQVTHKEMGS